MKQRFFPDNFLFGSAVSAYQTEGGNIHSNWHHWEQSGRTEDRCDDAVKHFEMYEQDLGLLNEMHHGAFRLSLEWSRLEPKQNEPDFAALEFYKTYLRTLRSMNVRVFVTLHHFSQPDWFEKIGGWQKKKNIQYFLHFVWLMVDELKDDVDFWVIFNEPMPFAHQTCIVGNFPPGKKGLFRFLRMQRHLIFAHRKAYKMIHKIKSNAKVASVHNNQWFTPYLFSSAQDRYAVRFARYFWNHYFFKKTWRQHDFIGVNYYFHTVVSFSLFRGLFLKHHEFVQIKNENKHVSDMGWQIAPEGMYHVLMDLKKYNLPVYVTENGIADARDEKRQEFIFEHLKYLYIAMKDLCDVRGYLYWSLLDNYEWGSFAPKFGLVEVNRTDMSRRVRPSALWYANVCAKKMIEF